MADPVIASLAEAQGDNLRYVYRHFPLSGHDKSFIAAEATEAAGAQGAFWEMEHLLYERQQEWGQFTAEQMLAALTDYAEELGLDVDRFSQDLEDHTFYDKVAAQRDDSTAMGLPGTPTFILNERLFLSELWGQDISQSLTTFIQLTMLEASLYDTPPPQVIDTSKQYRATIRTARGDIIVELYDDQAPANVNSFVFLAQEGWYDDITFFRVIPGFVAQAGDPTNSGYGNPGYACDDEVGDLVFDRKGIVAIANAGPNTGSSQFFITYSGDYQDSLNGHYTIIGEVVEGLDVLDDLTPRDPTSDPNAPPGDVIETILVEEQ